MILDIVQNNSVLNRLNYYRDSFNELRETTTENIFCKFSLNKRRGAIAFNYMKEWYLFDLKTSKYLYSINNCMDGKIVFNDNRIHIYKNEINRFIMETIKII